MIAFRDKRQNGPIAEPDDAQHILQRSNGVDGFVGASSIEQRVTEADIREQPKKFKARRFG